MFALILAVENKSGKESTLAIRLKNTILGLPFPTEHDCLNAVSCGKLLQSKR